MYKGNNGNNRIYKQWEWQRRDENRREEETPAVWRDPETEQDRCRDAHSNEHVVRLGRHLILQVRQPKGPSRREQRGQDCSRDPERFPAGWLEPHQHKRKNSRLLVILDFLGFRFAEFQASLVSWGREEELKINLTQLIWSSR